MTHEQSCFNPRPPRRTGATAVAPHLDDNWTGFNPRPPRRTGATVTGPYAKGRANTVSILARPEGRALLSSPWIHSHRHCVSILARPEGRALQLGYLYNNAGSNLFQSSPAPKDGRYWHMPVISAKTWCFNPRPPRRTGATEDIFTYPLALWVFQSSPAPKDGRYLKSCLTPCR